MICCGFSACESEVKNPGIKKVAKTIIEIEINNVNALDSLAEIGIYAVDILSKELTISQSPVHPSGRHRYELMLSEQQEVTLLYNYFIPLIVKPGDSIYITLDGGAKTKSEILGSQRISGTATVINENLRRYNLGQPVIADSMQANYKRMNPYDYKDYADSIYAEQAKFIDSLLVNNTYSEPLTNWFEAQKRYGNNLSVSFDDYYLPPKTDDTTLDLGSPTDQVSFLKYNVDSIPVIEDRYRINYHAGHTVPKALFDLMLSKVMQDESLCPSQYAGCLLEQIPKDYGHRPDLMQAIMYEGVQSLLLQGLTLVYDDKRKLVDSVLKGSIYEEALANNYAAFLARLDAKEIPEDVKLVDYKNEGTDSWLEQILAANPGKFVYINHWNTLCAMCIFEYTGSIQRMKQTYNDSVAFVYLCYDCKEPQWKAVITKYDMAGTHYFLDKEEVEAFKSSFDIKGFPNYTLLDSTGVELGNGYEFRPSERAIYDLLRKHSKNK